jgi:hypothetical protein
MWSVHFIGKPDAIKRALAAYGNTLPKESRQDFHRARYALEQLLDLCAEDSLMSLNSNSTNGPMGCLSVVLMPSNATQVQ